MISSPKLTWLKDDSTAAGFSRDPWLSAEQQQGSTSLCHKLHKIGISVFPKGCSPEKTAVAAPAIIPRRQCSGTFVESFSLDLGSTLNHWLSRTKPTTRLFYHHKTFPFHSFLFLPQLLWWKLSSSASCHPALRTLPASNDTTRVRHLSCSGGSKHPSSSKEECALHCKFVLWTSTNLPEERDTGSQSRSPENSALCKTCAACLQKSSKLLLHRNNSPGEERKKKITMLK